MGLSHITCALVLGGSLLCFLGVAVFSIFRNGYIGGKKFRENQDDYICARNTQSWLSVGLSTFSSGMGTWLLFSTPQVGVISGSLGVIGYSFSVLLPFLLMSVVGPAVKTALGSGGRGFTPACFVRERYGRVVQLLVSIASIFFMFIFLCTELTSIGLAIASLSEGFPLVIAIISVASVTSLYTVIGGTPTALLSDKIQSCFLFGLGLTAIIVVSKDVIFNLKPGTLRDAAAFSPTGWVACFVLIVSVTVNQFLDQGMWQRVFASKSQNDARVGLIMGGLLSAPVVAAAGFTGIVAQAARASGVIKNIDDYDAKAFFLLLEHLSYGWLILILLVSVALVTSTVDSIQVGIIGLVAGEVITQQKISHSMTIWTTSSLLLLTAFACVIALLQYSVMALFLVSNIVSCVVVPSVALSFWTRTTPLAVLSSMIVGFLSIPITGWIYTADGVEGLIWVTLPRGLFDVSSAITFAVVPSVTMITLIAVSLVHCYLSPTAQETQANRLRDMKLSVFDKTESPTLNSMHLSKSLESTDNSERPSSDTAECEASTQSQLLSPVTVAAVS